MLLLTVAAPPRSVPAGEGWPLGWLTSLASVRFAFAKDPGTPKQGRGPGAQGHYVGQAFVKDGRKSKPAKGELRQFTPHRPDEATRVAGATGEGFDRDTSKLVAKDSTARTEIYRNADGSFTRRVFKDPVNYQAADGTWKPIDSKLRANGKRYAVTANSLGISFAGAPAAAGPLVKFGVGDGVEVAYDLAGATVGQPVVDREVATYRDVLPGVDLELGAQSDAVKETLVLKAATAPTEYEFPLRLTGLTPSIDPGGGLAFADESGKTVATMPLGFMEDAKVDASGSGALGYGVKYSLAGSSLKVSIDAAWLHDPARKFPVKLDPTTRIADSTNDTYVQSGAAQNRVSEDNVAIGTFDGSAKARALLPFPSFGSTYAGKNISAAILNVFMSYQGVGTTCAARRYDVYPVTETWAPGAIAFADFPTYGASIGNASPTSSAACANTATTRNVGVWSRPGLSVASLNNWITGGSNFGLALAASETDSIAWKRFTSAEPNLTCTHSVYGAIQCDPFIEVTYTDNGIPQIDERYPANNATVGSITPELVAAGHDVDTFPNKGLRYNFLVYNDQGAQISTSGWTAGAWRVPAGILAWNKTYLYAVQINDWSSTGPAAPEAYQFTTQVPQAAVTSSLAQNGGKGFEPNVGNYTNSDTDAQVETTGPALTIARDYNSLDTRIDGSFAQGWSSMLDMAATEAVDGGGTLQTVTVRYPNGQDVAFGRNNDGTFIPPLGRFSVFKTITGGYSLTDKDTTTYEFTQRSGARLGLSKITDSNGRSLTVRYDANGRADQMKSVPSGRVLNIAWTQPAGATAFHVDTVTTDPVDAADPASALVWHYGYDADKLTQVCPPSSTTACTRYDYTGASQYVNAMSNTSPYGHWRLNEAAGSTTGANHEVTSDGADLVTYSNVTLGAPGPFPGSTATAAQLNGTNSVVKLPSKAGQRSAYQSVGLWFKTTTTAGGVLYAYQKDSLDLGTTAGGYNPALYVGTDGKLYGELWNGAAAPMVSPAVVNDDQWHYAVLAGYGNTQKLYLDGAQVGTLAGAITLFNSGLVNAYVGGGYTGGGWPARPATAGAPNYFTGSIAEVSFHNRAISAADVTDTYSAGVRPTAELSKVTSPGGKVQAQVAYDTVAGRVNQVTDENGGVWGVGSPTRGGSSSVYVSSVLGSQPTDYWRINDTAAPAQATNSALTNRATYRSVTFDTTQPNTTSPFSDSFGGVFNGTSSNLLIDNPDPGWVPATDAPAEGPASVEVWFKQPSGAAASAVLYSYQENTVNGSTPTTGNYVPGLYVGGDGLLRGEFWTGSTAPLASATKVNDGKWHHAILAASASKQTLYLDGKKIGSRSGTMTPTVYNYTYIGAGSTKNWPGSTSDVSYFKGNIAEFAYYERELTQADVDAHFRASASVAQPGQATTGSTLTPVNTVSITDPTGKVSKQTFDAVNGNRMVASADTLGNTTTYGYDVGGFESVVYDPIGQKTVTGKDVRGNAIRTEICHRQGYLNGCDVTYMKYYPDATTTNLTPDPRNDQLTDIREPGSLSDTDNTYRTHYDYDTAGNRTKMTGPAVVNFPAGRVTTLTYTDATTVAQGGGTPPVGLPAKVVSATGANQTTLYYASGDVFRVTDAAGLVTEFTYDGLGRTRSKTVKAGGTVGDLTTTLTYDADGQVVTQADPPVLNEVTGATHRPTTVSAFDPDGDVVSRRVDDSPEGGDTSRTVSSDYDSHGQMIKTVDPVGLVTLFEYDVYGNKTRTVACESNPDPGSSCPSGDILKIETDTYDSEGHGLVTTVTDADGVSTKVADRAYYPTGNLASETDAMGWTTKYQYDNSDEPTEITRTDGAKTYVVERNHYTNGRLDEQFTNNGASHSLFEYDQAGRLVFQRNGLTGINPVLQRTSGYVYDGDDHVITSTSGTITYGNDDPASYPTLLGVQNTTYDAMGRVTAEIESTDRASRPSAWWKFDEASGDDYLDSSGSARIIRNADPGGGGITRADGAAVINKASFIWDEGGPVVDTSKSYTVSTWVKMNNFTTAGSAVAQNGLNNAGFNLGYNKTLNKWNFAAAAADTDASAINNASSATALTAATWVNLVGTYDATSKAMKLYVNGGLGGSATNATPWQAKAPVSVGYSFKANDFLDGAVDNVQIYERTLAAGEVTTLFNAGRNGNVTASTGQLVTSHTVDSRGLTTATTDPNLNVTRFEYDANGQLTKQIDPATAAETYGGAGPVSATAVTRYGYNAFGDQTEVQDPLNNTVTTRVDAAGRPVRETMPDYTPPGGGDPIVDAHSTTEYDLLGQVSAEVDPLGNRTTYEYDILGNQTKVTDPAGKAATAKYDPLGEILESVDRMGAKSTATYDMLGRTLTTSVVVRQPAAQTNTTAYDYGTGAYGVGPWPQKITSPDGVANSTAYNMWGEPVTVKDGANNTTTTEYDGLGQPFRVTNPDSTKTVTSYDGAGRATQVQQLDNANAVLTTESSTFDNNGNMLTSKDARNTVTTFAYDASDNVTSEVQPITATASITTSFGYDLAGRRVRYTDGRGNAFWNTYNTWGLAESQIEPATTAFPNEADRTFSLAYDAAGQGVKQIAPGGVTVTNSYDDLGRLTKQAGAGAEAETPDRTFGYDDSSRLTAFSVPDGTDTISYDDRGLALSVNGPQDTSSFGYTKDGLMSSRTDAAGTTNYTYDTAGRFKTAANSTTGVNLSVNYNNMSQPSTIVYGSNNTRTLGYDKLHRLTGDALKNAAGTTTLGSITYGYDNNSNLTSKVTTGFAGAGSNTYTYDLADRLGSWTSAAGTVAYAYDNSGNRLQNGSKTFTYDARNQLLTGDGTTYGYTARGTMARTTSGSVTYDTTADAFGQITSQAAAGGTSRYRYDAMGRAVREGSSYTGLGNDLAKDNEFTYTRGAAGEVLAEGSGTGAGSALAWTDQHADVVGQFTATGTALAGSVTYDPLGVVKAATGFVGHLGYQSEWTDSVTGRVNMLARWYNPDTGQFDSRDSAANNPVPDSINANTFQYGDGGPLTTMDPTGHWGFKSMFKAATSFVQNTVIRPAIAVARVVTAPARAAFHYVASGRAWKDAKTVYHKVAKKASKAWHVVKESTTRWAKKKINSVKDAYHSAQKCLSKGVSKCAKATAKAAVKKAVTTVKSTYEAIKKDPWKFVATAAAGIAATIAVGALCATGIGCLILAGAVAGAMSAGAGYMVDVGRGDAEFSWSGLAGTMIEGGLDGALSAGVSKFTGGVTKGLMGGAAKGAGGLANRLRGGEKYAGKHRADGERPGGSSPSTPRGCHSFDPATRVLMADGSAKPIQDVTLGDKVRSTDPKTGETTAKAVTLLHINRDTDLSDVTVKDAKSKKSTTLHTTQHHPFWDATAAKWVDAGELVAGHRLLVDARAGGKQVEGDGSGAGLGGGGPGDKVVVTKVVNRDGAEFMRDLTVADIHTYYVLADGSPVLVHNIDPTHCDVPGPSEINFPRHSKRKTAGAVSDGNGGYDYTLSGWGRASQKFKRASTAAVGALRSAFGLPQKTHGLDLGVPGRYFDSHAEAQAYVLNQRDPIIVNRDPCGGCQQFFTGAAVHGQKPITVSSPSGVWVFQPTGDMQFAVRVPMAYPDGIS